MGVYDSVWVECPECNTKNEFQSKGGDCYMNSYSLEDAPNDVLGDVTRHSPVTCRKCGTAYNVAVEITAKAVRA